MKGIKKRILAILALAALSTSAIACEHEPIEFENKLIYRYGFNETFMQDETFRCIFTAFSMADFSLATSTDLSDIDRLGESITGIWDDIYISSFQVKMHGEQHWASVMYYPTISKSTLMWLQNPNETAESWCELYNNAEMGTFTVNDPEEMAKAFEDYGSVFMLAQYL